MSAKMIAPPVKAFFTAYRPSYDGANFPHMSEKSCVPLLQDEVSLLEGARSSLLVVSPLNSPLIELSLAQCRQSLLVDEIQLLIMRLGPFSFVQLGL